MLISEALAIIRGWNPIWKPKNFMVDYSFAEKGAIEEQLGIRAFQVGVSDVVKKIQEHMLPKQLSERKNHATFLLTSTMFFKEESFPESESEHLEE